MVGTPAVHRINETVTHRLRQHKQQQQLTTQKLTHHSDDNWPHFCEHR